MLIMIDDLDDLSDLDKRNHPHTIYILARERL
jgi:hypothetical protein